MPWVQRTGSSRIGGLLAGLGAILLIGGVAAVYFVRQPAAAVRTADVELMALRERLAGVRAHSPENQWPAFVAILDDVVRGHEAGGGGPIVTGEPGQQSMDWPVSFVIDAPGEDAEIRQRVLAELDRLRVFERVDTLDGQRCVPPLSVDLLVSGKARQLGRILRFRMQQTQSPAEFTRDVERLRRIAAAIRSQRILISELTASAIEGLIASAAVHSAVTRPPNPALATAMITALRIDDAPKWASSIDGERLFVLNEVREGRSRDALATGSATRGADAALRELATRVDAPTRPRAAWYASLTVDPGPLGVAGVLIPSTRFVTSRDQSVVRARAAQTIVALETRIAATGKVPERLEELVPEFFDALPIDPFSGEPLRYRVRTAAELAAYVAAAGADGGVLRPGPKPGPRPYLLYSVGADGVDNGGVAAAKPFEALSVVTTPASDFVLSPDEGRW